jgi:hypothetical protein
VVEGYEKLRPYWEAWKANNERPSDPREAANWDGMQEIFKAIAGDASAKADPEAVGFIISSRPRWESELMKLSTWDEQSKRLKLFRGVRDEKAISLRTALSKSIEFQENPNIPISHSIEAGVALGFAGKGHIDGCVYSVLVPLDAVIFFDLDSHYKEGGLHLEKEVVVWHKEPMPICSGDVIDKAVSPRRPLLKNRASRDAWKREKQRLEELERAAQHS